MAGEKAIVVGCRGVVESVGRGRVGIRLLLGGGVEIPTDSAEEEQDFAGLFGQQVEVEIRVRPPGFSETDLVESYRQKAEEAEAEAERLQVLVRALEEHKGVKAARVERTDREVILTAPGLDERKTALLLAAANGFRELDATLRAVIAITGCEPSVAFDKMVELREQIFGLGEAEAAPSETGEHG